MSHTDEGVRNGHVQIHVADDLMTAEVDLFPPAIGGAPFTIITVISELEVAAVTFGIDRKILEKNILDCLENEKIIRGVIVARGQKPQKAVPSYWHLKKRLINAPGMDLKAMNVDYRENSPYILVKKGEALAKSVPEAPGVPGRNLAGEVIPATDKEVVVFKPGEHTIEKEGILYAACHGRFEIRERLMSVNETLDIAGNVDYSTGHIAFPGDVIIHGSVSDGFQVASGKSIFVKQTMDASKVLCRGDLVVEGGIKGRQDALVRVDGRIAAKFIENATVEAHGDIVVEKAIMHTYLNTLDHVDLGEAGVLVGGEIRAVNGFRAGRVGRPESPTAQIRVGVDYTAERKLRSSREQIDRLETKLERLKSKPNLNEERQKLISQVETVLGKLEQTKTDLSAQLFKNRRAKVIILGEISEGTEIHICELSLRVSSAMEGMVFYYESDGPRIATRNIIDSDKAPFTEESDEEKAPVEETPAADDAPAEEETPDSAETAEAVPPPESETSDS